MIMIENPICVKTLYLTWQSQFGNRERFCVGKLTRIEESYAFSYLTKTADYEEAVRNGFIGYPAFPLKSGVFTNDVIPTFLKRIPPRSRKDFRRYLVNHHLHESFQRDDFDLIAHTGIQLPSDGFNLIPDLTESNIPFDYLLEVAGTRYYINSDDVDKINIGSKVSFICENDNCHDKHAIAIFVGDQHIGYVNKLMCPAIRTLLSKNIKGIVAKKSGTIERPLIYLMLSVY